MVLLNFLLLWLVVGVYAGLLLTLFGGVYLMAQIDDLKALLVEVAADQARQSDALSDLAADVDKLLTLVTTPGVDLAEVIQQATALRDSAQVLADTSEATASKYDSAAPPPEA